MTFKQAVRHGIENILDFRGTASRAQFWYWVLFTLLLSLVLSTIESVIWPPVPIQGDWMADLDAFTSAPTPLTTIASILLFIPNLAVTARRFHDAGFSAKWLLLQLIPLGYGIFAGKPKAWAQLRFTPERARWVAGEQWHPQQESRTLDDGSYELSVPYSDDRELVGDILRYGPDVQVLGPKILRQRIQQRLLAAVGKYVDGD